MSPAEDPLYRYGSSLDERPLVSPTAVDVLRDRARRRSRHRALFAVPVALLLGVGVVLTAADLLGDEQGLETVPTDETPEGSEAGQEGDLDELVRITMDVPEGWSVVDGGLYASAGMIEHFGLPPRAELTVSSASFPISPSAECDIPVAALDALGPEDVMVSVRELDPGQGTDAARPPAEEFLNVSPVDEDSGWQQCVADPDQIRLNVIGWSEDDRPFAAYVATGLSPLPARLTQLEAAIRSLTIGSDGALEGAGPIDVPNMVGLTLEEAREALAGLGLRAKVNDWDAPMGAAEVIAQEPPASTRLMTGDIVGLRTVLPDPPAELECAGGRHPRDPGSGDGLPHVGATTRQAAEQAVLDLRASGETSAYLARWDRWAWDDRTGEVQLTRVTGFQALVVAQEDDCALDLPSFHNGVAVTHVRGPDELFADALAET